MTPFMLDTNTVSYLLKWHVGVTRRLAGIPPASVYISSVTEAELRFGLAKRPATLRLHAAVGEFLRLVTALPFDSHAARRYGALRAQMEKHGKSLGAFDLLIAAHALSAGAVLVSSDRAFRSCPELKPQNWTE